MSKTTNKFSSAVRERAVRMVMHHEGEHASRWAAVASIAAKIGCSAMSAGRAEAQKKPSLDILIEDLRAPATQKWGIIEDSRCERQLF